jgi:hypothetical protein
MPDALVRRLRQRSWGTDAVEMIFYFTFTSVFLSRQILKQGLSHRFWRACPAGLVRGSGPSDPQAGFSLFSLAGDFVRHLLFPDGY